MGSPGSNEGCLNHLLRALTFWENDGELIPTERFPMFIRQAWEKWRSLARPLNKPCVIPHPPDRGYPAALT